ncbi:golgin subfamily A member 4 [Pelodytes ibericus]
MQAGTPRNVTDAGMHRSSHTVIDACTDTDRILKLESSLAKTYQDMALKSEGLATFIECETKNNAEITTITANHKQELETLSQEKGKIWSENLEHLKQEHEKHDHEEKCCQECPLQLKDEDLLFQAQIVEMNKKTLDTLNVKQTQLETNFAKLFEALKTRQEIEEKLSTIEYQMNKLKLEYEAKLIDERKQHDQQIAVIQKEKENIIHEIEKRLMEEINHLRMVINVKEKEVEELHAEKQILTEAFNKTKTILKETVGHLDEAQYCHQKPSQESTEANAAQVDDLQALLKSTKEDRDYLKQLAEATESQLNTVSAEIHVYKNQMDSLTIQLEEQSKSAVDKLSTLELQYETQIKGFECKIEGLSKTVLERDSEAIKLKEAHNQLLLDLKQTLSSKEHELDSIKEEYQTKYKIQESKIETMMQRKKELQDSFKKNYDDMESKLTIESEKKHLELINKEQQFNEKMLEMVHTSSDGINNAVYQLEMNHKEQLQNIKETHQREVEETANIWEKKLCLYIEELNEKYELELQVKDQKVKEILQQFTNINKGKEEAEKQAIYLKETNSRLDELFTKLQEQLGQAYAKISALTHNESNLKKQLENLEKNNCTLQNERKMLKDQVEGLKISVAKDQCIISELAGKLKVTEDQCRQLEYLRNKDHVDFEGELQNKLSEKEIACNHLLLEQEKKLDWAAALVESITVELTEKCIDQMNRSILRISCCENKVIKVTEAISKQLSKITELQKQLEQMTKMNNYAQASLNQANIELQSQQTQTYEKEFYITQVKKELSENINKVTSMKEALKEKDTEAFLLHTLINEMELKLENSVDLEEKEKAIAFVNAEHKNSQQQLENHIKDLMPQNEAMNQEMGSSEEAVNIWKNKLETWKKKAELKFIQNHNTIKKLQEQIEMSNKENKSKEEKLKIITEEFECYCSNVKENQLRIEGKEFDLTAQLESQKSKILELHEQLANILSENKCLLEEMERQHQQHNNEKKDLVEQLQHVQNVISEKHSFSMEGKKKMLDLEKETYDLREDLASKQREWLQMKIYFCQNKDKELKALDDRLTTENANKLAELRRKAEQKIASVKKQFMCQLEEKEQSRIKLENELQRLRENTQKENPALLEHLQQENDGHYKRHSLQLELHKENAMELARMKNELSSKEHYITELENRLEVFQKILEENEPNLSKKEQSMVNVKGAQVLEIKELSCKYENELKGLQEQLAVKASEIKICRENIEVKARAYEHLQVHFDAVQSENNTFKQKLVETEDEIQRFRIHVTKLQKDMRTLRKEHSQELDFLKKELTEEADQKIRHEQEDMELKHNSTLKQLMREFNTQMAQKEHELEIAVQETISKAQEVEAELMQTQHMEATQLHRKIAEKEDDLKRTVKKYEEILEAREEEMTAKVTELQEQLEKLQNEISRKQEEVNAQDSEIHTLEDKLKSYSQGMFVTPLGMPYKDIKHQCSEVSVFGEPTEFEYLRKVMFEYMMGHETKTMAKVITTVLRFPTDQAQKILDREEARPVVSLGRFSLQYNIYVGLGLCFFRCRVPDFNCKVFCPGLSVELHLQNFEKVSPLLESVPDAGQVLRFTILVEFIAALISAKRASRRGICVLVTSSAISVACNEEGGPFSIGSGGGVESEATGGLLADCVS